MLPFKYLQELYSTVIQLEEVIKGFKIKCLTRESFVGFSNFDDITVMTSNGFFSFRLWFELPRFWKLQGVRFFVWFLNFGKCSGEDVGANLKIKFELEFLSSIYLHVLLYYFIALIELFCKGLYEMLELIMMNNFDGLCIF